MTNTELTNKIKEFVLEELDDIKNYKCEARIARSIAFGVVFFATNYLYDTYNKELADWWDKEMLPQFNKKIRG